MRIMTSRPDLLRHNLPCHCRITTLRIRFCQISAGPDRANVSSTSLAFKLDSGAVAGQGFSKHTFGLSHFSHHCSARCARSVQLSMKNVRGDLWRHRTAQVFSPNLFSMPDFGVMPAPVARVVVVNDIGSSAVANVRASHSGMLFACLRCPGRKVSRLLRPLSGSAKTKSQSFRRSREFMNQLFRHSF